MTSFEMVKYHGQEYPPEVPLRIEEIAAHFDVRGIGGELKRSLHTEYSYGPRRFDSALVAGFPELCAAQKEGVPQLWKNKTWALQFADFIFALVGNGPVPSVIEIHPPFSDYPDIPGFAASYSGFEEKIRDRFPDVEILIENRCGSVYHGGRFIVSRVRDLAALCQEIENKGLQLKIAYDVPQIYSVHQAKTEDKFIKLLEETKPFRQYIGGVHLWGKKANEKGFRTPHRGNLNDYFGDAGIKASFLQAFRDCFDDNQVRKMVLEVNSGNEDVQSIVTDLLSAGIRFV